MVKLYNHFTCLICYLNLLHVYYFLCLKIYLTLTPKWYLLASGTHLFDVMAYLIDKCATRSHSVKFNILRYMNNSCNAMISPF